MAKIVYTIKELQASKNLVASIICLSEVTDLAGMIDSMTTEEIVHHAGGRVDPVTGECIFEISEKKFIAVNQLMIDTIIEAAPIIKAVMSLMAAFKNMNKKFEQKFAQLMGEDD